MAIVASQDGQWYRARSFYIAEQVAGRAARTYSHLTPDWADIVRPDRDGADLSELLSA
ncbi:hypothetical protein [Microbispora bryophytorum]|uniref:hypothetical protein n=1 Tax=Microbispora bryophytorum TaxID=1460882 RepID=UPI0033D728A1